jgi:hypothetical protein
LGQDDRASPSGRIRSRGCSGFGFPSPFALRFREAETLDKRALAIYEKALGPKHPAVAASLNDLGRFIMLRAGTRRPNR